VLENESFIEKLHFQRAPLLPGGNSTSVRDHGTRTSACARSSGGEVCEARGTVSRVDLYFQGFASLKSTMRIFVMWVRYRKDIHYRYKAAVEI
jgi:hypothetical protein